ncbi:hypothetical protein FTUN_4050 [Frigoriglobus tundricola]|uniref:Uncharacterized protein n=1 Tax=Frigoriglobus tundricola TaxID=2774151 RepID=A0A6M5YT44_9BACT|nr:hypothetical protein FTUN_4050 [Frigoriglobus tundricola]
MRTCSWFGTGRGPVGRRGRTERSFFLRGCENPFGLRYHPLTTAVNEHNVAAGEMLAQVGLLGALHLNGVSGRTVPGHKAERRAGLGLRLHDSRPARKLCSVERPLGGTPAALPILSVLHRAVLCPIGENGNDRIDTSVPPAHNACHGAGARG